MVIGLLLQIRQEVDKAWATTMDNFVNSQQGGTHVADFHGKFLIKIIVEQFFRKELQKKSRHSLRSPAQNHQTLEYIRILPRNTVCLKIYLRINLLMFAGVWSWSSHKLANPGRSRDSFRSSGT